MAKRSKAVRKAVTGSIKFGAGAKRRRKLTTCADVTEAVLIEFRRGTLHSGSGAIVKSKKQALAIAHSECARFRKTK